MPRFVLPGRGETGNGHLAETGKTPLQCYPVKSQPRKGRRTGGGDEEIGSCQQFVQRTPIRRQLQIQPDDLMPRGHIPVPLGMVQLHGVSPGGLHLDDGSPHAGEPLGRSRSRQVQCQINNTDTIQRLHGFTPLCQKQLGDDHPLHLVGPFVDLGDLGVPEHPLHLVIADETVPPMNLDCLLGDVGGCLRGEHLAHG